MVSVMDVEPPISRVSVPVGSVGFWTRWSSGSVTNSSPRISCPASLMIHSMKAAVLPVGSPRVQRMRFLWMLYVPFRTLSSDATTPSRLTACLVVVAQGVDPYRSDDDDDDCNDCEYLLVQGCDTSVSE